MKSTTSEKHKLVTLSEYHTSTDCQSSWPKNTWFQGVCLLRFDIELGSVLEAMYPPS